MHDCHSQGIFHFFPTPCQIAGGCPADATCLSSQRACRHRYRCTGHTQNTLLCGSVAAACCRSSLQVACKDQRNRQLDSKWKLKLKQADLWEKARHFTSRIRAQQRGMFLCLLDIITMQRQYYECRASLSSSRNVPCSYAQVRSTSQRPGEHPIPLFAFKYGRICSGCFCGFVLLYNGGSLREMLIHTVFSIISIISKVLQDQLPFV